MLLQGCMSTSKNQMIYKDPKTFKDLQEAFAELEKKNQTVQIKNISTSSSMCLNKEN